jgi:hypothetical protein
VISSKSNSNMVMIVIPAAYLLKWTPEQGR